MKDLVKYSIILFGLGGWAVWLMTITYALFNNGFVTIYFNKYNEMGLEFGIMLLLSLFFTFILIMEFKGDIK